MTQRKAGTESVPFAVMMLGADGYISSGNAPAHRMLALPDGALRGVRFDQLMVEGADKVFEVFQDGTPLRLQARMVKADGRVITVSVAVEPTNRDGSEISSLTLVCKPLPPWVSVPPPEGSSADL